EMAGHAGLASTGAAFIAVVVPAAIIRLGDFEADVGLDDASDGGELAGEAAHRIRGVVGLFAGFVEGLDALDGGAAGGGDDVARLLAVQRRGDVEARLAGLDFVEA